MSKPVLLQHKCINKSKNELITLSQVKSFLKIEHEEDDQLINNLITAARQAAENYLRKSLLSYSWQLTYQDHLPSKLHLSYGPAYHIESIELANKDGRLTTLASQHYYLNTSSNELHLHFPIVSSKIIITYQAGYSTALDIPELIMQGQLAHIGYLYEHRGSGYSFPPSILSFYHQYRKLEL